jgi:Flp pilus assembly protein protease CpaA
LFDPGAHRAVALALWQLPCALQDYWTRRVSNWLTVPLFVLAWPVALLSGKLPLTFAVFVGVVVA